MGFLEDSGKQGEAPSDGNDLDVQIASGMAAKMMSSPESVRILSSAFQSSNGIRTVAMFLAQLIERIQSGSEETDIPLDPSIWFKNGGVLDEIGDELSDIAQYAGAEFTTSTMEEIKAVVAELGKQRANQEGGEQ